MRISRAACSKLLMRMSSRQFTHGRRIGVVWVVLVACLMGILFLADNAGFGSANWVLRAITADIAEVLAETGHSDLAEWLTCETSPVQLYDCLDVRQLTPKNQAAFLGAIKPACSRRKERGPASDGFLQLFENLAEQVELLSQGKTPASLPNLRGVAKYNGLRSGPGWDDSGLPDQDNPSTIG
jgi:hypothetical protein